LFILLLVGEIGVIQGVLVSWSTRDERPEKGKRQRLDSTRLVVVLAVKTLTLKPLLSFSLSPRVDG